MGNHPVPPGDIHNPRSGLETLSHNPRLQVIRPAPVPSPRFDNLATPNKSIPTVSHRNLRLITKTLWQTRQTAGTGEINGSETPHTFFLPALIPGAYDDVEAGELLENNPDPLDGEQLRCHKFNRVGFVELFRKRLSVVLSILVDRTGIEVAALEGDTSINCAPIPVSISAISRHFGPAGNRRHRRRFKSWPWTVAGGDCGKGYGPHKPALFIESGRDWLRAPESAVDSSC